jgi:hypothetical protein
LEHLDSLRRAKGAERLLARLRDTKVSETLTHIAQNLRQKLRNPTIPLDATGKKVIEETAEALTEAAANPSAARIALEEMAEVGGDVATATRTATSTAARTVAETSKVARLKQVFTRIPRARRITAGIAGAISVGA